MAFSIVTQGIVELSENQNIAALIWTQFLESVVSLRGLLKPSYDHRSVFRPFPESIVSNERRENLRS